MTQILRDLARVLFMETLVLNRREFLIRQASPSPLLGFICLEILPVTEKLTEISVVQQKSFDRKVVALLIGPYAFSQLVLAVIEHVNLVLNCVEMRELFGS